MAISRFEKVVFSSALLINLNRHHCWLQDLEAFEPIANENSYKFLRLAQAVRSFKNELLKEAKSDMEEMDEKFKKIDKQIEDLESNLKMSVLF